MSSRAPIPTLGYPNQKAACVALALQGIRPKQIAEMTGASINGVHRALTEYRHSGDRPLPRFSRRDPVMSPTPVAETIWDMDEDDRRQAFIARAAAGARRTREAFAP